MKAHKPLLTLNKKAVAEAVNDTVADRVGNPPLVETETPGQSASMQVDSGVQGSTPRAQNAAAEFGEVDRVVPGAVDRHEDNGVSTTPAVAGAVESIAIGVVEENTIPVSSAASQTTTPHTIETNTEVVPSSEPIVASVETTAAEAGTTVPREDGSTPNLPISTAAEDQAASEAMIAALIVADLQAIDGEQPPQDPVNVDITPAPPPPAASGLPTDAWDIDLAPPLPQTATAADIVDSRSEGSSANDEAPRPVPHVYGFVQLFDAVKQEFRVHSAFIAKESATIKETVRQVLGYPDDKEFLIWARQKSYRTEAISANSIFEALDFRSDGFVLLVGDGHPDST